MKKIFLYILLISLLFFALTNCSKTNPKRRSSNQHDQIKIGVILPLTGQYAGTLGEPIKNGMLLAQQNFNRTNPNLKIELLFEDSQMDPKAGVDIAQKLIQIDQIKYIVSAGTGVSYAIQPLTEKNQVIIMPISIDPSITNQAQYTFRIYYNLNQATQKFLDYTDSQQYNKIALLYQQGQAWQPQVDILASHLEVSLVEKQNFEINTLDFNHQLTRIQNSQPDLLIILGYGSHYPNIFKALKELNFNTQILGGLDFLEVPNSMNKSLLENTVFVTPSFIVNPSNKAQEFIKQYQEKFNQTPDHQAAFAYDRIMLITQAIQKVGTNPKAIKYYLSTLKSYPGVVGNIEILPNGDSRSSLKFATYQDGLVVPYTLE